MKTLYTYIKDNKSSLISLTEKFRVTSDMNKEMSFDICKNINDVFEEFRNIIYQNTGDNKFYILHGLTTLLSYFSTKTLNKDEKTQLTNHIKKFFNKEILKLANQCKEYTWWDQDDEDLDNELYNKMSSLEDCENMAKLYDELIVEVPGLKKYSAIIIKGYVFDEWVVFTLNEKYNIRGFVICKL